MKTVITTKTKLVERSKSHDDNALSISFYCLAENNYLQDIIELQLLIAEKLNLIKNKYNLLEENNYD